MNRKIFQAVIVYAVDVNLTKLIEIKNIKHPMKNIDVEGIIIKKTPIERASMSLTKAILKDSTGEIILNLWKNQINQCTVEDKILIKKGFTRRYNGRVELNTWNKIKIL